MREPVVLTRDYDAPPTKVFAAWTDVDLLTKWFGCATDMLWTVHTWDVRVSGELHVSLDFDGTPYEVRGRFLEVDEPHCLRYEWEAGQIVTVSIEANGHGSTMTVEHAGLPNEEMDKLITTGWTAGVRQILIVLT